MQASELTISVQEWQAAGLTINMYANAKKRNQIQSTRACKGKPAEIVFDSIPDQYKMQIISKLGDPRKADNTNLFRNLIRRDEKAVEYYSQYLLNDGRLLPAANAKEYTTNAEVINAILLEYNRMKAARSPRGGNMKGYWANAMLKIESVRAELGHTLPSNEIALKRKVEKYKQQGYEGLISGKFCNDNSRKVTFSLEKLILSLYIMPNKPFAADVHSLYKAFHKGIITPVDKETGEAFLPENFMKDGAPIEISETTVWNYLNAPHNRVIVDSFRSGAHRFNSSIRPHHHRTSPNYSFSKISLDDRDLPRKMKDGKWLKAYYAYDVTSGCVIGRAYSRDKNEELFIECMQSMFRTIEMNQLPCPMEVEVEHHLVNKFFDDLGVMFPFLRICKAGNSQEKRAEHFNRAKKYSVEKQNNTGIGRWWAHAEAYRIDNDKVNDEFVEKLFTKERLIADEDLDIFQYNNQLHPKQKKFPGKTRWEVLMENINPNATQVNKAVAYRTFGFCTNTSIIRNQYCRVQNDKFQLPSTAVLSRLAPNTYEVQAYYVPDIENNINEVFLYQNGVFICKCEPLGLYNEAKAERTELDLSAFGNQRKFINEFDATIKTGRQELSKLSIIENKSLDQANSQQVKIIESKATNDDINLDDIINRFDGNGSIDHL